MNIEEYDLTQVSEKEMVNIVTRMLQQAFNPKTKKYLETIKDEIERGFKFNIISYNFYYLKKSSMRRLFLCIVLINFKS